MLIPKELKTTGSLRPQGYPSNSVLWQIYPNSSNNFWPPDAIVRLLTNMSQGYLDPYRSYLQI